ncbi:MAG: hypothetical protein FWB72_06040, partial [Firmicutes bacterium]|nr:hypothetical protein [Bacillota bacterium]
MRNRKGFGKASTGKTSGKTSGGAGKSSGGASRAGGKPKGRKMTAGNSGRIKADKNADRNALIRGYLEGNPKGYAFFIRGNKGDKRAGRSGDLFVAERNLNGARHGDKVFVKARGGDAVVESIIERGYKQIVGTFLVYNKLSA